jgi:hypothetical protein
VKFWDIQPYIYYSTKLIQNKYTEYDKRWGKQKGVLWTIKNGKSRSTCKIGHYSQLEDKQNKKHNTEN